MITLISFIALGIFISWGLVKVSKPPYTESKEEMRNKLAPIYQLGVTISQILSKVRWGDENPFPTLFKFST